MLTRHDLFPAPHLSKMAISRKAKRHKKLKLDLTHRQRMSYSMVWRRDCPWQEPYLTPDCMLPMWAKEVIL